MAELDIHVISNFIEEKDALDIISEINSPSEKQPYPDYYSNRNGGTALPYNKKVLNILKKYSDKSNIAIKELFNLDKEIYSTKGYSSKWATGGYIDKHIDDVDLEKFIEWSTVIYLNDDFEGGEIYFTKKDFQYKPIKFSAVFFPQFGGREGNQEYEHGVTEVKNGYRYTLLFHHSSNIKDSDPDLL
jgi:hypothetical protein